MDVQHHYPGGAKISGDGGEYFYTVPSAAVVWTAELLLVGLVACSGASAAPRDRRSASASLRGMHLR